MKNTIKGILAFALLLIICTLQSCRKYEPKDMLSERIIRSDFVDNLLIDGTVESVRSITVTAPRGQQAKIIFLVEDGTPIQSGDTVCILESEVLQSEYDQSLIEMEKVMAQRNKMEADLNMQYAMLEAQVKTNAAQTAITNLDTLQLKYLSPNKRRIKELELQKIAIEKNRLERKLAAQKIINESQLQNMDMRIRSFSIQISSTKEQLDALKLVAPQSGMGFRNGSFFHSGTVVEGDQVFGGMPLINIPDLTEMKVTLQAPESDYKQININDEVEYTFDAMPGYRNKGKILSKAPVGVPIKENSKVKYFRIEASMDKTVQLPQPGLSVHCNIILNRLPRALTVPQLAIFNIDSMKVVFIKQGKFYEKRQVKVGKTSLKRAVITAGLKAGERVSLLKPESKLIHKTTLLPLSGHKQKTKTTKKQQLK